MPRRSKSKSKSKSKSDSVDALALVSLGVVGTRWQPYAEEAIAHLRHDVVRVGMLSCDVSPGALRMVREMARRGWVEYDNGAYRMTLSGREAMGAQPSDRLLRVRGQP